MNIQKKLGWLIAGLLALAPLGSVQAQADLAAQAHQVLKQHCFECHGGKKTLARLNVLDRDALIQRKVLVPGKAGESELVARVSAKDDSVMPPPERPRMSAEEIALLRAWVDAGAAVAANPDAAAQPAAVVKTPASQPTTPAPADDVNLQRPLGATYVLQSILQDIRRVSLEERRFYRYFSLTHLLGGGTTRDELVNHRDALAKAINHLTWQPKLVRPTPVESTFTVFRVDLRELGWHRLLSKDEGKKGTKASEFNLYDLVLLEYPYGIMYGAEPYLTLCNEFLIPANQIRPIPYVRADWFVSVATQPPLYHDLMQLPMHVNDLEKMLEVNSAENIKNGLALRGGVIVSGVSRNNRVNERHPARFGHYWKSYDFKSSQAQENIFLDPLHLNASGGEMIFNLPNGLQGYYIANDKGLRVNEAPTSIVVDKFASDKTVRNGLACMRCHDKGTQPFTDVVRPIVAKLNGKASFDIAQAIALYGEQSKLDGFLEGDKNVFLNSMRQVLNKEPTGEPLRASSQLFLDERVTLSAAAAELGLAEQTNLSDVFGRDEFLQVGLAPLAAGQPLARDAWELYYDRVVRLIGVGTPISNVDAMTRPDYSPAVEPPFKLEVKTNKRGNTFEPKDELVIFVKSSKDVFIEVVGTSARGNKVIMVPATTKLKAGQQFRFPPEGKKILVPKGPAQETITVLASTQPFAAGEILTATQVADRVVHPYRLVNNGNQVQVQISPDPVNTVKTTLALEIRVAPRQPKGYGSTSGYKPKNAYHARAIRRVVGSGATDNFVLTATGLTAWNVPIQGNTITTVAIDGQGGLSTERCVGYE